MRISVDIDDETLDAVMAITGEKNKSPAVAKAVTEFIKRQKAKEFGHRIREGFFDYPAPSQMSDDLDDPANPVPPVNYTDESSNP